MDHIADEDVLRRGHYAGWSFDDGTGIEIATSAGPDRARGTFRRLWWTPGPTPGVRSLVFAVVQWVPGAAAGWRWVVWWMPQEVVAAAAREGAEVAYRLRHAHIRVERPEHGLAAVRAALARPPMQGEVAGIEYAHDGCSLYGQSAPATPLDAMRQVLATLAHEGFCLPGNDPEARQPRLNPPPADGARVIRIWVPETRPLGILETGFAFAIGVLILHLRYPATPMLAQMLAPFGCAVGGFLAQEVTAKHYVRRWATGEPPDILDGWIIDAVRLLVRWVPICVYFSL